ncbi:MAG: HDIG domain-containing metalloprotein, partial [Lentisphaerota bacterium]
MMNREECLKLLAQYVQNPNMIKHCLASEIVLVKLAERLGQDNDKWAAAGLLHDLDVEITHADLKVHGQKTAQILRELNFNEDIIDAIVRHNEEATQ